MNAAETPRRLGAFVVADGAKEIDEGLIHFDHEQNRFRPVQADASALLSYRDALGDVDGCPGGTVAKVSMLRDAYGRPRQYVTCASIPLGQLPKQDVFRQPPFDVLPEQQRIEATQPVVAAYIGERPVFLSMPDVATSGGRRRTVPLTVPRMRRQYDIYYGRAADPYARSELTGVGQEIDPAFLKAHEEFTDCLSDCDGWWERTFGDPEKCVEECVRAFTERTSGLAPPGPGPGEPPEIITPTTRERLQEKTEKAEWWIYAAPAAAAVGLLAIAFWPKRRR